jgi:hypothetical protein
VNSSLVRSAITSFAMLASIENEDIVDARADKSVGGTWQRQQSFTVGHSAIADSHDGARVGCERRLVHMRSFPGMC